MCLLLDNLVIIIRDTVITYTNAGSGMLADMDGGKALLGSAMTIMRSFLMIGSRSLH